MAKAKAKSKKPNSAKGISPRILYLSAVACFVLSKIFHKADLVNYAFAITGFALFGIAFYRFFTSRRKR
ncbi:hypothetical protein [Flavobacterium selenitireducens]|uniref:hypothetical protein n=1 Tax=Flavobacterium selenitireducens TaxID=2722704 RepID=UPI00168BB8C9|nr:hypothetical protein [Flavobacterium selenitireducens]MBD3582568.1 hypothetical protein [Flavobacterium selenitireducens]